MPRGGKQGFRLSGPECKRGGLANTRPKHRKKANAVLRRPKVKISEDGVVTVTTRKNLPPRPKEHFPFLESTKSSGKKWKVKKIWDGPDRLGARTGPEFRRPSPSEEARLRRTWNLRRTR